jgi:hypothetical protein
MITEAYSNRDLKKKSWEELVDIFMNQEAAAVEIGCTQNHRFLRRLRKRENKNIKAPSSSNSILRLTHDWWRIWWLEIIFSLPGKAPPKFVVARPWWRRVYGFLEFSSLACKLNSMAIKCVIERSSQGGNNAWSCISTPQYVFMAW